MILLITGIFLTFAMLVRGETEPSVCFLAGVCLGAGAIDLANSIGRRFGNHHD